MNRITRRLAAVAAAGMAVLATTAGTATAATAVHATALRYFVVGVAGNVSISFRGQHAHYGEFVGDTFMQAPVGPVRHVYRGITTYSPGGQISCSLTVILSNGRTRLLISKVTDGGRCALRAFPLNAAGTRWSVS